ncbi:MAG: dockerin type I domain-containing protein [Chloroflexota bacterium]|nr:dockerin type I domain-containing protein [Chloroflexota bacterium]
MLKRLLTALTVASLVLVALAYAMPFLEQASLQDTIPEPSSDPASVPVDVAPVEAVIVPAEQVVASPEVVVVAPAEETIAPPPVEASLVPVEPTAIPLEPTLVPAEPTVVPMVPTIEPPKVETMPPPMPTMEVPKPDDFVPTMDPNVPVPTVNPAFLPPTQAPVVGAIEMLPVVISESNPAPESAGPGGNALSPVPPVTDPSAQVVSPPVVAGLGSVSGAVDSASASMILVILTDVNGQVIASTVSMADGSFALIDVPAGDYVLTLDDGISLLNQQAVRINGGQMTTLAAVVLVWGDVNRDNAIDELDVVTIASLYGQPAPTSPVSFDINGDGRVGLRELMLMAENYGFGR